MKVIICGAGQVGYNLAKYLSEDGHNVAVIDQTPTLIGKINNELDVQAFVGQCTLPKVLEHAGAADADLLIAVTQLDEVNIVTCQVAHSLFNIPTKIARIRQQQYLLPEWSNLFQPNHIAIDHIISPEIAVADTILQRIRINGAFNSIDLAPARIIGIRCNATCPIINTPLRQLTSLFPDLAINVLAILRAGELIIPSSHDQMLVDDSVYFLTDETHIARSMNAFGIQNHRASRAVIVGGGNIGQHLAKLMIDSGEGYRLKIIELSKEQARSAAESLPLVTVIQGDGLQPNILEEAGLSQADLTISVTDDDETNILSSLLCKHLGVERTLTLINKSNYGQLVTRLGVDVIINPREITASSILQYIRRGKIRAVHSLFDGLAEILQIEAIESSSLVGVQVKDTHIPTNSIIGGIVRDDKLLIPRPDTEIERGDLVIILAATSSVKKIEKLFSVGIGYYN